MSFWQRSSEAVSQDDRPFFLPNLCKDKSVFFLVLVSEAFVVLLLLADTGPYGFDWQRLGLLTLHVQWVCLTSAGLLCLFREPLSRLQSWQAVVLSLLICVLMGVVVSVMGQALITGSADFDWNRLGKHSAMTILIAGLVMRYFYLQQQLIISSRSELQARIQALHSRIRPHFLFNSMNIIASLIPNQPEQAEKAVEDLADLFRASLKQTEEKVSLHQEIDLCQRFMFIEQLRLGDRLRVSWDIQADTHNWQVPLLSLQPLLENAVIHGIQALPQGGEIQVRVYESEQTLKITVINPVATQMTKDSSGNQLALENIRDRLASLYGRHARVSVSQNDQEFICILSLPRQNTKGAE
jgi:two-component system sensor histidine kinase AlgZ